MSNSLFFIPARAGSKRVPGKNYKLLSNLPLIVYSIQFALSVSSPNDVIVVSTDCPEILSIASHYNIVIHKRPDNLAQDDSSLIDVFHDFYSNFDSPIPSQIILLQQFQQFTCIYHYIYGHPVMHNNLLSIKHVEKSQLLYNK